MTHRSWLVLPLLLVTSGMSPVLAAPVPIRQVGSQSEWSTPATALRQFVSTGEIRDRGLMHLIQHAGWGSDELRIGLTKPYRVDAVAMARYLTSEPGERFLSRHLGSYGPTGAPEAARLAMRSAILAAASDGLISSMDLLANLPTDFSLRHPGGPAMPVCGHGAAMAGERGRSWLSWLVFLPACLQAEASVRRSQP